MEEQLEQQNQEQPASPKSKKGLIISIVIIVILVLGGGAFAAYYYGVFENENDTLNLPDEVMEKDVMKQDYDLSGELIINYNNIDSDGDHLLDEHELIWETDPNNEDTDGDGFNDGDEIKAQFDPRGTEKLSPENTSKVGKTFIAIDKIFEQGDYLLSFEDEDEDGLDLFEEMYYGLEPNNADSDGDGTRDANQYGYIQNFVEPKMVTKEDGREVLLISYSEAKLLNSSFRCVYKTPSFFGGFSEHIAFIYGDEFISKDDIGLHSARIGDYSFGWLYNNGEVIKTHLPTIEAELGEYYGEEVDSEGGLWLSGLYQEPTDHGLCESVDRTVITIPALPIYDITDTLVSGTIEADKEFKSKTHERLDKFTIEFLEPTYIPVENSSVWITADNNEAYTLDYMISKEGSHAGFNTFDLQITITDTISTTDNPLDCQGVLTDGLTFAARDRDAFVSQCTAYIKSDSGKQIYTNTVGDLDHYYLFINDSKISIVANRTKLTLTEDEVNKIVEGLKPISLDTLINDRNLSAEQLQDELRYSEDLFGDDDDLSLGEVISGYDDRSYTNEAPNIQFNIVTEEHYDQQAEKATLNLQITNNGNPVTGLTKNDFRLRPVFGSTGGGCFPKLGELKEQVSGTYELNLELGAATVKCFWKQGDLIMAVYVVSEQGYGVDLTKLSVTGTGSKVPKTEDNPRVNEVIELPIPTEFPKNQTYKVKAETIQGKNNIGLLAISDYGPLNFLQPENVSIDVLEEPTVGSCKFTFTTQSGYIVRKVEDSVYLLYLTCGSSGDYKIRINVEDSAGKGSAIIEFPAN